MTDATSTKVRRIIRQGVLAAYRPAGARPDPECVDCFHGLTAHHGADGEERCGEKDCPCTAGKYES